MYATRIMSAVVAFLVCILSSVGGPSSSRIVFVITQNGDGSRVLFALKDMQLNRIANYKGSALFGVGNEKFAVLYNSTRLVRLTVYDRRSWDQLNDITLNVVPAWPLAGVGLDKIVFSADDARIYFVGIDVSQRKPTYVVYEVSSEGKQRRLTLPVEVEPAEISLLGDEIVVTREATGALARLDEKKARFVLIDRGVSMETVRRGGRQHNTVRPLQGPAGVITVNSDGSVSSTHGTHETRHSVGMTIRERLHASINGKSVLVLGGSDSGNNHTTTIAIVDPVNVNTIKKYPLATPMISLTACRNEDVAYGVDTNGAIVRVSLTTGIPSKLVEVHGATAVIAECVDRK